MTYEKRRYQGPQDLKIMQELIQRNWDLTCREHVGDIAWAWCSTGAREADWPVQLWFHGSTCVGWGWICYPHELRFKVDSAHLGLLPEIFAWFEETATAQVLEIDVLDLETPYIAALESRGYEAKSDGAFSLHMVRDLADLP